MKVKNFMKKAIAFCLGLAMTAGVGYGIAGNRASEVDADTITGTFEKMSDDLVEGDYIFVTSFTASKVKYTRAMKNTVSSSKINDSDISIVNNQITNPDSSIVWHIAPSGSKWTIYNAAVSKYVVGTGTKSQADLSTSSEKGFFTVTNKSNGQFEFSSDYNKSNNENAIFRHNKGATGYWACYASDTAPTLYKKVGGIPTPTKTVTNVIIAGDASRTIDSSKMVGYSETLTATVTYSSGDPDSRVNWSATENGVAKVDSSGKVTFLKAGTTTITATAVDDSNQSASVTYDVAGLKGSSTTSALTVAEMVENIDKFKSGDVTVYGKGIVYKQVSSSSSVFISDDGETPANDTSAVQIYKPEGGYSVLTVGNKVILHGTMQLYNNKQPEFNQNAKIDENVSKKTDSITIKTSPTKLDYYEGENFEPEGLVIFVNDTFGGKTEVAYSESTKSQFSFNPTLTDELEESDTKVTITYDTKSCDQEISVTIPSADTAIQAISAIGEVSYTEESYEKISTARAAYNALPEVAQKNVTNYQVLLDAEDQFETLELEAVSAVETKIDDIGTVTLLSGPKIELAESAYAGLLDGDLGKNLVSNYDTLVTARAAYNAIIADVEAAEAVEELIEALPEPEDIEDYSHHKEIQSAKDAYDALSDTQKGYVSESLKTKLEDCVAADALFKPLEIVHTTSDDDVNGEDNNTFYLKNDDEVNVAEVSYAKGSGSTKPAFSSNQLRIYAKGSLTIKPCVNFNIKGIILDFTVNENSKGKKPSTEYFIGPENETNKEYTEGLVSNQLYSLDDGDVMICSFPGEAGNVGFSTITVQYEPVEEPAAYLTDLTISNQKTEFSVNDEFELGNEAVVTAFYSDDTFNDELTIDDLNVELKLNGSVYTKEKLLDVGTYSVKLSYTDTGVTKDCSYEISVTKTIVDPIEGNWELLEDADDIVNNSRIVIASTQRSVSMGDIAIVDSKLKDYSTLVDCLFSDDEILIGGDTMVFRATKVTNGFTLVTDEGKHLGHKSASLLMDNGSTEGANYVWVISVSDGSATIKGFDTDYVIRYNTGSPRFKTYNSATGVLPNIYIEYAEQKTVTWNVEGDETEETYSVGEMPSYKGETPTKPSAGGYNYEFSGWDPEVSEVTDDITYTAQFDSSAIEYSITYENEFGGACGNPTAYTVETDTFTLKNPETRPGYMFLGWYNGDTLVGQIKKGSTGDITLTAKWESFEDSEVTTEANFKATSKDGHVEKIDSTSLRMCINVRKGVLESLNGYDFRIKVTLLGDNKQEAYLSNYIVRENGLYKTFDATMIIPENMRGKEILVQLEATKGDNTFLTEGETVSYNEAAQSLDRSKLSALQLEALKMILGE